MKTEANWAWKKEKKTTTVKKDALLALNRREEVKKGALSVLNWKEEAMRGAQRALRVPAVAVSDHCDLPEVAQDDAPPRTSPGAGHPCGESADVVDPCGEFAGVEDPCEEFAGVEDPCEEFAGVEDPCEESRVGAFPPVGAFPCSNPCAGFRNQDDLECEANLEDFAGRPVRQPLADCRIGAEARYLQSSQGGSQGPFLRDGDDHDLQRTCFSYRSQGLVSPSALSVLGVPFRGNTLAVLCFPAPSARKC